MLATKNGKKPQEFYCHCCDYTTHIRRDYTNHLLTDKHQRNTNPPQKQIVTYECEICKKCYLDRTGLWRHSKKKNCKPQTIQNDNMVNKENIIEPTPTAALPPLYEMISDLLKQNNELQKQIIELSKEPKVVNNYNTNMNNNNTTNNQFNLNMFLNETCKDALNVQQFLDNMNFTLEDLETVGKSGFVKGISELIVRSLRELEINKRPIHCTDTKRETIYLKEDDVWNKDDDKNSKIKMVIKQVEDKNYRNIREWERIHPEGWKENTPDSVVREQIIKGVCGAAFDEERMRGKVVKEIVKEIQLNKTNLLTSVE
jgi:hypothetical protein